MINEERVKELFQLAVYDQHESRQERQTGEFYRSDYVGKEVLKSFFYGSIAFALILGLYVLYELEDILNSLSTMDYVGTAFFLVFCYLVFMAVYLLLTAIVYRLRYRKGRMKLRAYYTHLKKVNKMYENDDKFR